MTRSLAVTVVVAVLGVATATTAPAAPAPATAWTPEGGPSSAQAAAAPERARVFVSEHGDDDGPGTRAAPYDTFARALDSLGAAGGTVLVRGGTYSGQRIVLADRSDVTVRAYRHERPVLDASGLVPADGDSGVVQITDGRRLAIRGLTITGYRTSSLRKVPVGIYVSGSTKQLTIADNHIHHLGNDNTTRGSFDINAHGIAVYGTDPHSAIRGLTITGNELDHLVLGASETLAINGNVAGWSVVGNDIHDDNNIGIDAIGYEPTIGGPRRYTGVNRARHGLISGNVVRDIVTRGNPSYREDGGWCDCAGGIYVDGGRDITITDNRVTRADIGIEVGAEDSRGSTDDVVVRRNQVTGSRYVGLAVGGYAPGRGTVSSVAVTGNRLRGDNTLHDGSPEVLIQFNVHDVAIRHNHVWSTHRHGAVLVQRLGRSGPADESAVVLNANDYRAPVPATRVVFAWLGREVRGLRAWRRVSGQDRTSTVTRAPAAVPAAHGRPAGSRH